MKIAYVSAWDMVGQQFNGLQLTRILRRLNVDARMFVYDASAEWPNVIYELRNSPWELINRFMTTLEKQFSSYGFLPIYTIRLLVHSFIRQADIIHLQMIHGVPFFSLLALPLLSRKKTVILSLHDPWMATGHCVHPLDCQRWKVGCGLCPDLKRPFEIKSDHTHFNWRVKKWIFDHSKIHLVAASQWTYRIIQDSPILSDLPCTVIPFGLNTRIFYPHDKQTSRQKLGIPANNHVIMFRCMAGTPYKGLRYIKEALAELDNTRHNITLLTVGSTGLIPELTSKYQIIEMGTVYEPEKMADVLSAADIFLMPSIAESFGMMAVEAMACGVIPLVFEGTALPDITHAPHCGIAVPSKDSKALLEAIYHLLNDPADYSKRSAYALELVKSEYNTEAYIRRHMNLYYSLSSQCWQPAEFECAISLLNLVCNQDQQPLKQNPHIDPIWWRALRKIKRLLFPQKVK